MNALHEEDGNVALTATLEPFAFFSSKKSPKIKRSQHSPHEREREMSFLALSVRIHGVCVLPVSVWSALLSSASAPCWGSGRRLRRCVSLHRTPATLFSLWGRGREKERGREGGGRDRDNRAPVCPGSVAFWDFCESTLLHSKRFSHSFAHNPHSSPRNLSPRSIPNSQTKLLFTIIPCCWLVEPGAPSVPIGQSEPGGGTLRQSSVSVVDCAPNPPSKPPTVNKVNKSVLFLCQL